MLTDSKIRNSVVAVLSILFLFLLAETIGEIKSFRFIGSSPTNQSIISVSGKGEVVAVPDIATFSLSVTEESLAVKQAQDSAAEKMNAIIAYLKKQGVSEKDIQTSGYNICPRYEYEKQATLYPSREGKRSLAAYVVTQSLQIKIRDLGNAGTIIGGIGELGATDVSGLSFTFDKDKELKREARDKAIVEAREQADKLARSLGVTLVRIVGYNENPGYPIYAMKAGMAYCMGGDAAPAPEIPVGAQKITSDVSITYEVK